MKIVFTGLMVNALGGCALSAVARYVTGQVIYVDGGALMRAICRHRREIRYTIAPDVT